MNRKKVVLMAWVCAVVSFQLVLGPNGFCAGINEVQTKKVAVDLVRDVQKGGYKIIRTDELKQWMDQGKEMGEKEKAAFIEMLGPDKDRILVFYCGFTKCTRSHNGAMWAKKLGYQNAYRCPGGIKGWVEAGLPVEKAN